MNYGFVSFCITAHIALALYLLFLRVDLDVALRIYGKALKGTLWAIPVMALVLFAIPSLPPGSYASVLVGLSLVVVVVLVLAYARDQVIPRHSGMEVIFLSIAIGFAARSNPAANFLLSPMPVWEIQSASQWWLNRVIGLWPVLLVLVLLRRRGIPDPRIRLLLAAWLNVAYLVLLAPTAWQVLNTFDASAPLAYAASLLNSFVAIHVVMRTLSLLTHREHFTATADATGPGEFYASRFQLGQIKPVWALIFGAGFWLLLQGLTALLGPGQTLAGLAVVLAIAFGAALRGHADEEPEPADTPTPTSDTIEQMWERRRFLPLLIVPLGIYLIFRKSDSAGFQYQPDPALLLSFEVFGYGSLAILLLVAVWLVTAVLDGLRAGGRRWVGWTRVQLMLATLLVLILWRFDVFPAVTAYAPPPAERVSSLLPSAPVEVAATPLDTAYAVPGGVVYLGPERVSRLRGKSGKVLFLQIGGKRHALCGARGAAGWTFTHYQFLGDKLVECRNATLPPLPEKENVHVVSLKSGQFESLGLYFKKNKPKFREVTEDDTNAAAACSLDTYPQPLVRCGERSQFLPTAEGAAAVWPTPAAWHIRSTRKTEIQTERAPVLCLTAEVEASLPFDAPARWPALVLVRLDTPADQPLIVATYYGEGAACDKLALGEKDLIHPLQGLAERRLRVNGIQLKLDRPTQRRLAADGDGSPAADCVLEAEPQPRVRCGERHKNLFTRPEGVWRYPAAWHVGNATRTEIRAELLTLVCFAAEVEGAITDGRPLQRLPGVVVVRLDEKPGANLPLFETFDESASCDRIAFNESGLPYFQVSPAVTARLSSGEKTLSMTEVWPGR